MIDLPPATQTLAPRHDVRVMIVEDDPEIARLVSDLLAEEGYITEIVTLDVMMPRLDGISLCLELRRNSEVPILFISSRKDPRDRAVGLRIGADDYIAKPFDNDELVARVEALLRRSGMTRDGDGARQIR